MLPIDILNHIINPFGRPTAVRFVRLDEFDAEERANALLGEGFSPALMPGNSNVMVFAKLSEDHRPERIVWTEIRFVRLHAADAEARANELVLQELQPVTATGRRGDVLVFAKIAIPDVAQFQRDYDDAHRAGRGTGFDS